MLAFVQTLFRSASWIFNMAAKNTQFAISWLLVNVEACLNILTIFLGVKQSNGDYMKLQKQTPASFVRRICIFKCQQCKNIHMHSHLKTCKLLGKCHLYNFHRSICCIARFSDIKSVLSIRKNQRGIIINKFLHKLVL